MVFRTAKQQLQRPCCGGQGRVRNRVTSSSAMRVKIRLIRHGRTVEMKWPKVNVAKQLLQRHNTTALPCDSETTNTASKRDPGPVGANPPISPNPPVGANPAVGANYPFV